MFSAFYKKNSSIHKAETLEQMHHIKKDDVIWVDLIAFTKDEEQFFERLFELQLQYSEAKSEEIESTSRYFEVNDIIYANTSFISVSKDDFTQEPATFIFHDDTVITVCDNEIRAMSDAKRKIMNGKAYIAKNGFSLFTYIMENRVDADADIIEYISKQISILSKSQKIDGKVNEEDLVTLDKYQDQILTLRENVTDKQRVVSALLKNQDIPEDIRMRLGLVIKDINSLLHHTEYSFERLEYLQNTFMGLVNLEQNKIVKIFTVASVIFMPPTLIASIYGMNFKLLPELDWKFGYPFAIFLMILSSVTTLIFFRKNKWL